MPSTKWKLVENYIPYDFVQTNETLLIFPKKWCIVVASNYVPICNNIDATSAILIGLCANLNIQYITSIVLCKYSTYFSLLLFFYGAPFLDYCAFSLIGILVNMENVLSPSCFTNSIPSSSLSLTSLITHH